MNTKTAAMDFFKISFFLNKIKSSNKQELIKQAHGFHQGKTVLLFLIYSLSGSLLYGQQSVFNRDDLETGAGTITATTQATGLSPFSDFAIDEKSLLTVDIQPVDKITCDGSNTSFFSYSSSTPTPSIQWERSVDGSTWVPIDASLDGSVYSNFTGTMLDISGATYALNNFYYRAVFSNIDGSVNSDAAQLKVGKLWKGNNPNTGAGGNWECGNSPSGTDNIIIPTIPSGGHMPILNQGLTVNHIDLMPGATIDIGGETLTVNGTISGSGSITGSTTSNLVISGAAGTLNFDQTSPATRCLNNLTLDVSSSATLGSALDVYGNISTNSTASTGGALNLNGQNLTLKSNSTNTATIDRLKDDGSNLTGATNVTVERWIPKRLNSDFGGRAYRVLGSTVITSGSIQANWMEAGMNTVVGTNVNPNSPYGIQITGSGGNNNGFDVSASNASSLYMFTPGTSNIGSTGYPAVTSVNGPMDGKKGYFLYIRGDRAQDMTVPYSATGMPTSSTTLRTKGTVQKGNVYYTISGTTDHYTLITNPYPAPLDWNEVSTGNSNISTSYILWNPNNSDEGGFVTVDLSDPTNRYIQPGQAFFVRKLATGGTTVTITEAMKAVGNNNNGIYRPATPYESFATELFVTQAVNNIRHLADAAVVKYGSSYSANVDDDDADDLVNWRNNISISRANKYLAIEARPLIVSRDTIPLYLKNMRQTNYEFEFTPSQFTNTALKAELIDNYLNTRTPLSVTGTVTTAFTVTTDPASAATDRFMIVFGPLSPLAVDAISIRAQSKPNGIQVDWTSKTETDMHHYEVERSANGRQFNIMKNTTAVGNSAVPVKYSWLDASPIAGTNFYRIKAMDSGGQVKYSPVVKVSTGKAQPEISINPNPVSGSELNIQLTNVEKGTYMLILYNNAGQQVFSTQVQHAGGSTMKLISLGNAIVKGSYQLLLSGDNGVRITKQILCN